MRRRLSLVIVAGVMMAAAPVAWGATATFNVEATCVTTCGAAGIDNGDPVTGRIELSTDGFSPSGAVTRVDLVNFGVSFGETSTIVDNVLSHGYGFTATWGATANAISGVSFTASNGPRLGAAGPFLSFGPGGNVISLMGTCLDVDCLTANTRGAPATLGPVTFRLEDPAPVPLPGTGLLAATGCVALAAAGWIRRVRRRAA